VLGGLVLLFVLTTVDGFGGLSDIEDTCLSGGIWVMETAVAD
jgi:hypothetical protein